VHVSSQQSHFWLVRMAQVIQQQMVDPSHLLTNPAQKQASNKPDTQVMKTTKSSNNSSGMLFQQIGLLGCLSVLPQQHQPYPLSNMHQQSLEGSHTHAHI
jgi:hypothetical protein